MVEKTSQRDVWSYVRYCHIAAMEGMEEISEDGGRRGGGVTNEVMRMNKRN